MAEERGGTQRPHRTDRPPFGGPRPFRPPPRQDTAPLVHTFRLREGDREIEVSGSAVFVRQALDDLPILLSKLRGEEAPRSASIRMPPPGGGAALPASRAEQATPARRFAGNGSVEERILAVLREADRPLAVAAIRKRLGSDVTPQQVRRAIERASDRISTSRDRPATYRIAER
jgi:hypothetical protein